MVNAETPKALLRVDSYSGVRVDLVARFLADFNNAYSSLAAFESAIHRFGRVRETLSDRPFLFDWHSRWEVAWQAAERERAGGIVGQEGPVILTRVQSRSPGFWEFLGALNLFEVMRHYLQDRHERRKDRSYREADEARKNELENTLLELDVLERQIAVARQLGVTDEELLPLR